MLTEEQLSGGGQDGAVVVSVSDWPSRIVVPSRAVELLDGRALRIESDRIRVTIPAETLRKLWSRLSGDGSDAAGESIVLKSLPQDAEKLLAAASSRYGAILSATSELRQWSLELAGPEGRTIASLEGPIGLELLQDKSDPHRTGFYRLLPDGTLRFEKAAGGAWVAAEIKEAGLYGALSFDRAYADVPTGHWASDAIQSLTARLIVQGDGRGAFEPGRNVTRAEFAAMLVRALRLEGAEGDAGYSDVPADSRHAAELAQARHAGLAQGSGTGRFEPDRSIQRQEMAAMLIRAYALRAEQALPDGAAGTAFRDAARMAAWAKQAIGQAQALGLIEGAGNGRFLPDASGTRAEAARMIQRLLALLETGAAD